MVGKQELLHAMQQKIAQLTFWKLAYWACLICSDGSNWWCDSILNDVGKTVNNQRIHNNINKK